MREIKYRSENEMKDSGIKWIGKVPSEWEVKKIKHIIEDQLKYGANESAENDDINLPRYIRITDFGDNGKLKDDTFRSLDYRKAKDYLLKDGDILFARSGATVGKTFYFKNYNGVACYAGYLIKATTKKSITRPDFLYYFTRSQNYDNWRNSIFVQATIQNIGADKYKELSICQPLINEQQKIANFLDFKTEQLDSTIAKKELLIDKLEEAKKSLISEVVTGKVKIVDDQMVKRKSEEMKESGVEWLGMIPKEWEVKKLKFISECYPSNVDKKSKPGETEVKLCNYTDVYYNDYVTNNLDFMVATANNMQVKKFSLNMGDIILTKDSESPDDIGIASYVSESINNLVCGYHLTLIKPYKKYNSMYIYYYLLSTGIRNYFETVANGITRYGIGISGFSNAFICVPTSEEQQYIAFYIKRFLEINTSTILNIRTQIQKLKEAKQSLISEAVTGKIDLRDWEIIEEGGQG